MSARVSVLIRVEDRNERGELASIFHEIDEALLEQSHDPAESLRCEIGAAKEKLRDFMGGK